MLTIETQNKKDAVIISLQGEMLFNDLDEADRVIMEKLEAKPRVIAIQCKHLQTLDSSGLGLLIRFSKEAARNGVKLVFLDITDHISALFDVSKLDAFFEIMSSDDFTKTHLA
ncbi:MAG: STAS domain-containing protein [Spirochaetes bacterium]|nr:STAS domain-containing protein [Spirochaetota bacterium]